MAKTSSTMLALGTLAPPFILTDVISDKPISFGNSDNYLATVLMFICNHCPFVKHINKQLVQLANDYQVKNIRFIAINSNDVENYPSDSPENMKLIAEKMQYPFPYVFDDTQDVARDYHAACTPDFFIFNNQQRLVYRGQLDDARPGNEEPINGASIRNSLDCLIKGAAIPNEQKPSIGCNIKWKN